MVRDSSLYIKYMLWKMVYIKYIMWKIAYITHIHLYIYIKYIYAVENGRDSTDSSLYIYNIYICCGKWQI